MIKTENIDTYGWGAAVRGMRNPMNSWEKSDSSFLVDEETGFAFADFLGEKDLDLMRRLRRAGSDHRKYLRMITVTMDITAPLYWWKEFDTYKVGTVANSTSTMHKIHAAEFSIDNFSHEHMLPNTIAKLGDIVEVLNTARNSFLGTGDKEYWWQMIQLLPSSYNQRRTIQMNYETCLNIYNARKNHKLDEWRAFCQEIRNLPYFEEICIDNDKAE